ncbi:hypothetical protein F8M41_004106 [Gigaspora margarita]|uniref:Uncharacterized protein n=1 Tax=Gigaspora margarita TaxID=4874 RepID=A0A8H4AXV0_GIGMA|nr:hypothetical protein F8M41_004106 [Gigaspora margarita]
MAPNRLITSTILPPRKSINDASATALNGTNWKSLKSPNSPRQLASQNVFYKTTTKNSSLSKISIVDSPASITYPDEADQSTFPSAIYETTTKLPSPSTAASSTYAS